MSRTINHLFPIEIQVTKNEVELKPFEQTQPNLDLEDSRPLAHRRIGEQLIDQAATVVFSFPGECREEKIDHLIILYNHVH